MNPEPDVDALLDDLRYRNPLSVFAAVLLGGILLACLVNFLTGAVYEFVLNLALLAVGPARAEQMQVLLTCLTLPVVIVACILLFVAYFKLSQQQEPSIGRLIALVLPFTRERGVVRFQEIGKIKAQRNVQNGVLAPALKLAAKAGDPTDWHGGWQFDNREPAMQGDAVTLVYDLVEWMLLAELREHGREVAARRKNVQPGDDFKVMPVDMAPLPRPALYQGKRVNFFGQHNPQFGQQTLLLPAGTTLSLQPLSPAHGVEEHGRQPVNRMVIANPAGRLIITPSQVWRQATSQQIKQKLNDLFAQEPGERCYLELAVQTEVSLKQWPFILPYRVAEMRAYQRWLLELQAQMVRHMDWQHFVQYDNERMVVDIWQEVVRAR